jgi:hypothetical protein
MQTDEILRQLVAIADADGEQIQHRAGTPPNRGACILMTAIGCEVLARFNIRAAPFSVHVLACNAAYLHWEELGRPGLPPPDACWVDTRTLAPSSDRIQDGFAGHLLVHLPDYDCLLDLDLRQFARPAHQLRLPGAAIFEWPKGLTFKSQPFAGGAEVWISATPELTPKVGPELLDVAAHFASEIVSKIRG